MTPTILIVDDHVAVRSGLRSWLEDAFPQYRVIEAANAEDAIAVTLAESPNLIVMDIRLPGMNGIEATRRIKAMLPSTQIVMLTLYEDDVFRAEAAAAGATAYVSKQMALAKLIPTLTPLLANAHH